MEKRGKKIDVECIVGEKRKTVRIKLFNQSSFTQSSDLLIQPILQTLHSEGIETEHRKLEIRSPLFSKATQADVFIPIGVSPVPETLSLPMCELETEGVKYPKLVLRLTRVQEHEALPGLDLPEIGSVERYPILPPQTNAKKKERIIGHVIEKVSKWREIQSESKRLHRSAEETPDEAVPIVTLEEAANDIGIPKKSLDDYLLMIRKGKKLGFNFERHKNDKVGVLRTYVKEHELIVQQLKSLPRGQLPSEKLIDLMCSCNRHCREPNCCRPPGCDYKLLTDFSRYLRRVYELS